MAVNKTTWVAIAIVGAVAAIVAVLSLGGSGGGGASADETGDVVVDEGPRPPDDTSIADIAGSSVHKDGDLIVFEATMAGDVPSELDDGSLELRWDVSEGGQDTWIVSASINVGANAAVTSQRTTYTSTTINETLPGEMEIDGDVVRVSLDPSKIKDFPEAFGWRLSTILDGVRDNTRSGTASDTAPESGSAEFP